MHLLITPVITIAIALFWLPEGIYNFAQGNFWITIFISVLAFLWLSLPIILASISYSFISKFLNSYFIAAVIYLICYELLVYPFPTPLAMSLYSIPGIFAFGGELFGQVFLLFLAAILLSKNILNKRKYLLILSLLSSMLYSPELGRNKSVKIGLVQPAIEISNFENEKERSQQSLQRLYNLTSQLLPEKPKLIIWPESSVPYHSTNPKAQNYSITFDALTGIFSQGSGNAILYNELLPDSTREMKNAITLRQANGIKSHYFKQVLFPLGETLPSFLNLFSKYFPMASNFIPGKTTSTLQVMEAQNVQMDLSWQKSMSKALIEPETLPIRPVSSTPILSLMPLLCFEAAIPGLARESFNLSKIKPKVLVNMVNDSWFPSNWQREQHSMLARIRAMELNRPLIRAALGGKTVIYSGKGKATMEGIPLDKPTATSATLKVPLNPGDTLFSKYGNWVSIFFISVFLIFLRYCKNEN
ncbi:MAG: apolipoprotein N-acyltransferase [Flammeovirgaceae bacterium]|nr:apolipoprotein N-acyltransferase [Flammeovirgaceae bacterium]